MQNQVQQRSPIAVALLPFVTFGIYSWYWYVKVKGELNRSQNQVQIPTALVWLIPFVGGIWYMWKFSQAVEVVTNGKYTTPVAFLLLFVLGTWLGGAILQDALNKSHNQPMGMTMQPQMNTTNFNNYYGQQSTMQQPQNTVVTPTPDASANATSQPTENQASNQADNQN